ncbi:hypothetical protein [Streptosporangium roseum]|uniref:Uncharacterized protein n=1 Tax=Streptosporangium roseum (strain ATCC 12428 / DSM 43021 / JCM 3005 / KCTC 9067 / NCIMB 10171 / NRRL 2505 / NI 9100) TaxID=479432 RepID=D2BAR0_STRRD|nr:hypothetical protein [Streptosporangium roseum]ACZ89890.1 hypothetical protein Sros_7200 [Streptosporangium roseum DSM 43021]
MPTYVTAEAATSELPRVALDDPPKSPVSPPRSPVKKSRIGDLPMRVIYRILAVVTAVVVAAVAAVVGFVYSGPSDQPGGEASGPIAAPSAATPSPGVSSPPAPSPLSSASSSASAIPPSPSPAVSAARAQGRSAAVVAALADPRVPGLPRDKRLGRLPGKEYKTKRRLQDAKSGVSLARLGKPWKTHGASPFSTKQVLPKVKGVPTRAMLVSCPVPIKVQESPKDTALLAARWTLNHHPEDARIGWTASQRIKGGWVLAYRVRYEVKGKPRFSMAAVAVTEVPGAKPAMVFVTIPDAQRKRWRDINTAISSIRLK